MQVIETSKTFLAENPKFGEILRPQVNSERDIELKRLHEENTALLLSLKITQRELELHKESAKKWRDQCEVLLKENANLRNDHVKIMNSNVEHLKSHQKAWEKEFDYCSSDEEDQ